MFHVRSLIGFILLLFATLPSAQAQRWKRDPATGRLQYTEFSRPISTTTNLPTMADVEAVALLQLPYVASPAGLTALTAPMVQCNGYLWKQLPGVKTPGQTGVGYIYSVSQNGYYYAMQAPALTPAMFGAKGDRTTDDVDALRRLGVAGTILGKPVLIPADYRGRITDQWTLPGSLTMVMESGSEIWLDNTSPAKRLIYTGYSLSLTGSGHLTGSWSKTGQFSAAVKNSQISSQDLVRVEAPNDRMIDVDIRGIKFRRAGDWAIVVTQQSRPGNRFRSINIVGNDIRECYHGIHLNNLDNPEHMVDAVVTDNTIRQTAMGIPGLSFNLSEGTGNGLVGWGQLKNLKLLNNTVDSCGRMGVELFLPGDHVHLKGWYNYGLQIVGNRISNCGYFDLSQQGNYNYIARNSLSNWHTDYIEMLGNGTIVEKNILDGVGFSTTSNDRGAYPADDRNNLIVRQNSFKQRSWQMQLIEATYSEGIVIEENTLDLIERRANVLGLRSPIQVQNCLNAVVRNNRIKASYPFMYNFWNFGGNVNLTADGDQLELTGYPSDSLAGIISLNYNRNSTIRNFRVKTDAPFRMRFNVFDVLHYPLAGLYSYVWTGTAFVTTPLAAASVQTTPPVSPATNATYWLGDTPTGDWAGQKWKLAKWTGSAWLFSPVTDIFPYASGPTKEPLYSRSGLPTRASTVGTTYLLMDGPGLVNFRFDNNDFSAGGRITDNNNQTGFQLFNTRLWNVGVFNTSEPLNTNSLQVGDVQVQKTIVPPAPDLSGLLSTSQAAATYTTQSQNDSRYTTQTQNDSRYTTQAQNDVRYLRPGIPTTGFSLTPTDAAGNGTISQNGARVFHSYGTDNLFVGNSAGNYAMTGVKNVGFGPVALNKVSTGSNNASFHIAGANISTGSGNVSMGYLANGAIQSGNDNISLGVQAGNGPTSASANSANINIGTSAGLNNVGNSNQFIGYSTGQNATYNQTVVLGHNAGTMAAPGKTVTNAILIGQQAGRNAAGTTYSGVIALGSDVLNGAGNLTNVFTVSSGYTWLVGSYTLNGTAKMQVTGGLGADNVRTDKLTLTLLSGAGPPTTTQLPGSGDLLLWNNTSDNTLKLYVNQGGTIKGISFN
ncbi:hypothetical protein FAES_3624 [Fibrella aestuarina BUZ 2]|uniref:Right handed beta helix domain-containing protein n=1 Tax=Fibrella aestuarina BUZ 2 TaxID=1166018 RepID=I0KBX8_9BACT|nr:DUF2793 domain-containing protein [Fibrella aestuarina]CCH01631.1 hypothetical protein FAES_3624 [Fibrella aestuarina BUZ 2]